MSLWARALLHVLSASLTIGAHHEQGRSCGKLMQERRLKFGMFDSAFLLNPDLLELPR